MQIKLRANPDHALWYGWNSMKNDLVEIKSMAEDMRNLSKLGMKRFPSNDPLN
jgi:hypothetical protein